MNRMVCATTEVRDLTAALVLDIKPANGYERLTTTGPVGVGWRFGTIVSRYVEGEIVDGPPTRGALVFNERIKVLGDEAAADVTAYWESVEDRLEALITATSTTFLWTLSLGGYLWTYRSIGPANVDASETDDYMRRGGWRMATLSFRVQPNPTKVPLGGGA